MAAVGWSQGERIRILAPSWMNHLFGDGVTGDLVIGESLELSLLKAIDRDPLTRGCGLQIGAVGYAKHGTTPLNASRVVRSPNMYVNTSIIVYIGPALSAPPTPPPPSAWSQRLSSLFSTSLSCALAVVGWVGAAASVPEAGASFGLTTAVTLYLTQGAVLSTVQCLGGAAQTALVFESTGGGDDDASKQRRQTAKDRLATMNNSRAWKTVDAGADFWNFMAVATVGREVSVLRDALNTSGARLTDAARGVLDENGVVTMAKLMELRNAEEATASDVSRVVRSRIMDSVAYGLGFYSSDRSSTGAMALLAGHPPPPPGPPQPFASSAQTIAPLSPGAGPPGGPYALPPIMDQMLNYKPDEVATISVGLLRVR